MKPPGILILTRSEIATLMQFEDYMEAVEQAFTHLASKKILGPGILDVPAKDGMFHVKGAGLAIDEEIFVAVKVNGNFPGNQNRFDLPTIQGAIVLCDGVRGYPIAFMDSTEITIQRTGAATAVAAKYLARQDATTALICGCGKQGRIQLIALSKVLPIKKAFAYDREEVLAQRFAAQMSSDFSVEPVQNVGEAAKKSDVIVTCTTSRQFFLLKQDVSAGTFVAAVGADSHDKQELEPALVASGKVVTDLLDQCARIGDLHHAIEASLMSRSDVYAELHEIVSGAKMGRTSDEEIIVFDSTGTAIQDVAAAAVVFQRANERGIGKRIDLMEF